MNISPTEAEEALAAIQTMMKKTRRAISSSGAYVFLIIWGVVWLLGFLGSQFLPQESPAMPGWSWISWAGSSRPLSASAWAAACAAPRRSPPASASASSGCCCSFTPSPRCGRLAGGRETNRHVHHPVRHGWLDGHGPAALLCLRLARTGHHRPGAGRLLPAARYLLSVDGGPGRRRDDRPRPVHPLEVVNHDRKR